MRRLAGLAVIAACVASAGCGTAARPDPIPRATVVADLAASPPELASLHRRAGRIIDSDPTAFRRLLSGLRGHPVVINEWESWCVSCAYEMPIIQRASVRWGRRVAFVGVDVGDVKSSARRFLRRYPTSYPSYFDPDDEIAQALHAFGWYPQTIYVNAAGRTTYRHPGAYGMPQDLDQDIRRYALG